MSNGVKEEQSIFETVCNIKNLSDQILDSCKHDDLRYVGRSKRGDFNVNVCRKCGDTVYTN